MKKLTSKETQEALDKLTDITDSLDKQSNELTSEMSEVIDTLIANHKNDPVDDSWNNISDMMDDIREHARNNGRSVINEDRPHQLRLGWRCTVTNKTWSIKLTDCKKSIDSLPSEKQDILHRALSTVEGKKNLTASLNSKE